MGSVKIVFYNKLPGLVSEIETEILRKVVVDNTEEIFVTSFVQFRSCSPNILCCYDLVFSIPLLAAEVEINLGGKIEFT